MDHRHETDDYHDGGDGESDVSQSHVIEVRLFQELDEIKALDRFAGVEEVKHQPREEERGEKVENDS